MSLPPLIRWPGGQSREARRFAAYLPEHDTYVEPFAGGASFFFEKPLVDTQVLGDTNEWLIPFYDQARKGKLRNCRIPNSCAALDAAQKKRTACAKWTISALGYGGFLAPTQCDRTKPKHQRYIYDQKRKRLGEYERKLRRAHLTTGSFDRTMGEFDSPTTFHLLDPPWPENHSDTYYGNDDSEVPPERVAKTTDKMQGEVWILYNNHPAVRKAFCNGKRKRKYICYRVPTRLFNPAGGSKVGEKLLITTSPIQTGKRRRRRR